MKDLRGRVVIGVLAGIHILVLWAGFFAPYAPAEQARAIPYAPPSRIHFVDAHGTFHARPFVHAWVPAGGGDFDAYVEDTARAFPLRFFVRGAEYSIVPGITSDLHLFGVDAPGRIAILGTDGFGRDVLSRLLIGGRLSLGAGLLAALCSLLVGLTAGTLAGFYGGALDRALMRAADLVMAVPWLYLLFALRAALPLDLDTTSTLLVLVGVVGVLGWPRPARLIRGVVRSVRERGYVMAARGFGGPDDYLLRRHVLPHVAGVVLTQAALLVPEYVLAEVTLSFLGLGVGEPAPSWGNMLGALQQYHVLTSYWWMFAPAAALVVVALAYHQLTATMHQRFGTVTV